MAPGNSLCPAGRSPCHAAPDPGPPPEGLADAARTGVSEGRQLRDAQDTEAETPVPTHPGAGEDNQDDPEDEA